MITSTGLYWITRLDYLQMASFAVLVFSLVFILVLVLARSSGDFDISFKQVLIPLIPALIGAAGAVFIPSTKEMAAILVIPKLVNNEKAQRIPDKILDLCTQWLDSKIAKKGE